MSVQRDLFTSRNLQNSPFHKLAEGAAAGWLATVPMTLFMELAWRLLPAAEKYPLPPRKITHQLGRRLGLKQRIKRRNEIAITLFLHFAFGAMAGTMYAALEEKIHARNYVKGIVAGLLVWSGSYLGWIPAAKILPSATRQPWRRNLLMIAAHIVWGAVLGLITQKLKSDATYIKL